MDFEIDLCNRQNVVPVDLDALEAAVLRALELEQVASAVLSISIVGNEEIHALNRDHLNHDYPTDVISFQLDYSDGADLDSLADSDFADDADGMENDREDSTDTASPTKKPGTLRAAGAMIEGEVIASADMAASMAADGQWSTQDELALYVVHGVLHICGYDDLTEDEKAIMRSRERAIMATLGLRAVYTEDTAELSG